MSKFEYLSFYGAMMILLSIKKNTPRNKQSNFINSKNLTLKGKDV